MRAKIGILTVSDRAYRGVYEDLGGPAIHDYMSEVLTNEWEPVAQVVPDELDAIQAALISLVDDEDCSLVVTTGGTGPAVRDITPEATEAVCEKMMPGFGELMRQVSLQYRAHRHSLAADGGHPRPGADRQPAWQTQRHPRLPGRGHAGHPLLHRPDRRRLFDDRREPDCGFPTQAEVAPGYAIVACPPGNLSAGLPIGSPVLQRRICKGIGSPTPHSEICRGYPPGRTEGRRICRGYPSAGPCRSSQSRRDAI